MKSLIYYLLQMIIASGILYVYYHFVLRNKKFHRYNRFYLLAATIISILIPFLNIPVYFTQEQTDSSLVLQTLTVISSSGSEGTAITPIISEPVKSNWFTWGNISCAFYILVAGLALLRIIFSLKKIRAIIKNNPVEDLEKIRFVNTDEPGTPFSFFRWLFWNRKIDLISEKGEQVFRHELFHIEQKHSLDIVFMELLTVVFWINPFFHLMKKELKAIHEFLADQFAVKENQKWEYAELLLMQALNTNIHLTNPFFHNQIKRRIAMITSSQKPKYQYLRKLLVLPVAAMVAALFAFSYKEQMNDQNKPENNSLKENPVSDTTKPQMGDDNKVFEKVEIESSFPGGEQAWKKYLLKNLDPTTPVKNGSPAGTYTVFVQFIVDKEGYISNIKALTHYGYGMEEEVIRIIKHGPQWMPAMQNGQKVKAYRKQPVTFVVVNDKNKIGLLEQKLPEMVVTASLSTKIEADMLLPRNTPPSSLIKVVSPEWRNYLLRNLNPLIPISEGWQEGTYEFLIRFAVNSDGFISEINALNYENSKTAKSCVDIIKRIPKILPAKETDNNTKSYYIQPITFVLIKEKDEPKIDILPDAAKNVIFTKVEIAPSFPGGDSAWKKYLVKNLDPSTPIKNGAPEKTYIVDVKFIVSKDGNIRDITPLTHHGYGMEEEVVRILKQGPSWVPAMQNGYKVTAYKKQSVTFVVTSE